MKKPSLGSGHPMNDLFSDQTHSIKIAEGAFYYPTALSDDSEIIKALKAVLQVSPTIELQTPMGKMSSKLSSCGAVGWHSDINGYQYTAMQPHNGLAWPAIPECFIRYAQMFAEKSGYPQFLPNTCLINRYIVGAKMGLHTDANEFDSTQPVVSISLGLSCTFLFGGNIRQAPAKKLQLNHGDIVVWGGPNRHAYHGVNTIHNGKHPEIGRQRFNITLRYVDLKAWQKEQR